MTQELMFQTISLHRFQLGNGKPNTDKISGTADKKGYLMDRPRVLNGGSVTLQSYRQQHTASQPVPGV